jgi:hypothetical protein
VTFTTTGHPIHRSAAHRGRGVLRILGAVTIGLALVGCALLPPTSSAERPVSTDRPIEVLPVVSIIDRPAFAEAESLVVTMFTEYSDETNPKNAYDLVPQTEAGLNYAHDFLVILADIKGAFAFLPLGTESTNVAELDATIQTYVDKTTELERKFLAGEDLGVSITLTRSDGSVYESDGGNPQSGAGVTVDTDAEEFALTFSGTADADGSYAASAQELASRFGISLSYDFTSVYAHCMHTATETEVIVAAYCHATPAVIYVNPAWLGYPRNLSEPAFIDTVKHELAHRLIGDLCGTSSPPITGTANEGVANSYAALFLGANPDQLARTSEDFPEYAMTPKTDALARGIHDRQQCA